MLKRRKLLSAVLLLFLSAMPLSPAMALSPEELREQGELLADFLVTGRGVVAQSLSKYQVNNPDIGNKGFTPDIFERAINEQFKQRTGVDILAGESPRPLPGNMLELLKMFLAASKKVCEDNQPLINMQGMGFKGFIPATYGKMTSDIFREKSGIAIKQTTLVLRNSYNTPDDYEKSVLQKMAAPEYPKGRITAEQKEGKYRVMRPIYIEEACLACHGEPKGEIDVAGRKKEGYKLGELRGAISVSIPAQ